MLGANVLLARKLGAGGYGIYVSGIALAFVLGIPASFGLPTLVVREVARYRQADRWGSLRGILVGANYIVIAASVTIGAIGILVIHLAGQRLQVSDAHVLYWTMSLLPAIAITAICAAALRGLHHVLLGQIPEYLVIPGLFFFFIAAWSAIPWLPILTPSDAVALRLLATLAGLFVASSLLLARLPAALRAARTSFDWPSWLRAAAPLMLVGGVNVVNTQADVLMLVTIQGPAAAGVYRAAARGSELVALSLVVVNTAIEPTLARLYAAGRMADLQRVVTNAARIAILLALPMTVVMIVFGPVLLRTVFGNGFEQGALPLSFLCIGQIVNAGAGSVGTILNMTGHERDSAVGMVIGAATNVVFCMLLIPHWGPEGAAIASGLSLIVWNLVLMHFVKRRTGLASTALGSLRGLR